MLVYWDELNTNPGGRCAKSDLGQPLPSSSPGLASVSREESQTRTDFEYTLKAFIAGKISTDYSILYLVSSRARMMLVFTLWLPRDISEHLRRKRDAWGDSING
jgi:hypothetical protein